MYKRVSEFVMNGAEATVGAGGPRTPARDATVPGEPAQERVVQPAPWQRQYEATVVCCDLLCVVLALVVVALGYHTMSAVTDLRAAAVIAAVPLAVMIALPLQRAWDPRALGSGTEEYRRVTRAYLLALAVLSVAGYAWGSAVGQSWIFGALPIALVITLATRKILRHIVTRFRRRGRCVYSVLVTGDVEEVHEFISRAQDLMRSGWKVEGICLAWNGPVDQLPIAVDDVPVLGTHDDIVGLGRLHRFDAVALLPSGRWTHTGTRTLSWDLEEIGAELLIAPVLMDVVGPRLHIAPIAGVPLLRMSAPRYSGPARAAKNIFDRVLACTTLVVLAPALLLLALAVRIESSGPILDRQVRLGRGGKPFTMLTFRSTVCDEPRVTRVGTFLRRYSLDHLSRLFNVVRGDMSLVGPRPLLRTEVARYGEGGARRRLFFKPGMTGLWQVSGRSNLSWEESVRADLGYVENWTFALDLSILRRTPGAMLRREGTR